MKRNELRSADGTEAGAATENTPPPAARPQPSQTKATCARLVHVYSSAGNRPKPGLVIEEVSDGLISVSLPVHGSTQVQLFDPLTVEEREVLAAEGVLWAEWMPFQKGQAQKTEQVEVEAMAAFAKFEAALQLQQEISQKQTELLNEHLSIIDGQQQTIKAQEQRIEVLAAAVAELSKQLGGSQLQPTTEVPKGNFPAEPADLSMPRPKEPLLKSAPGG